MNVLMALSTGVSILGWSLLHFVWQAAAIGVVYALVRAVLPRGNPRYLAALLALIAMAACPIATGLHEFSLATARGGLADVTATAAPVAAATFLPVAATPSWRSLMEDLLPWLVLAWAVGAGILGVRVYRQWKGLRAMLMAAEQLPEWQSRARQFADRLGLRRMVPVLASVRVATPTLVGWVKPVVVLPLAVLAGMPPAQIDLVLAHELAHLKRLDHIANLFQVVLETLFFYHPVVHWISREARNERELCCDIVALRVTGGERRDFVAALANLEDFRAGHLELTLAASGGVLAERAWFIAGAAPAHSQRHSRSHAVFLVAALALASVAGVWWRDTAWQHDTEALAAANNTSVLRWVQQDATHPLVLLPLPMMFSGMRLSPVAPAAVSAAPVETVAAPVVRLEQVTRPVLSLVDLTPRVMPVSMSAVAESPPAAAVAPRALHAVRPVYPDQALIAGIQGQVVVEFTLGASGVPQNLAIVDSSAEQLDASALRALGEWRFVPPTTAGRRYRQIFTFQLGADVTTDAAAARPCIVRTGTHICRPISDAAPDTTAWRPNG